MEKVVYKPNDAIITEFDGDNFVVISKEGERTLFDRYGHLIKDERALVERRDVVKKECEEKPKWYKYFFFMGASKRQFVKKWFSKVKAEIENDKDEKSIKQKAFLTIVEEALDAIDYDYSISTMEFSFNKTCKLGLFKGADVARGLSFAE